jgi:predicted ester cyclase
MRITKYVLGAAVAGVAMLAVACSSSTSSPPAGTSVTPSSTYVAPSAAGTALGNANIARFERIVTGALNGGNLAVVDQLVSPTVVDHQNYGPGYPSSRAGIKALTAALRTAFPDLHATTPTLLASNDGTQTFAIVKTTGTNTGPYLGIKPTGRKIDIQIVESALWKNGIMVEHWGVADNIALLTQMGFFPPNAFPLFQVKLLAPQYQAQLANPPTITPVTATTPQEKLAVTTGAVNIGVNQGDMFYDSTIVAPNYQDFEYYGRGYPATPVDDHKMAIGVNRTALPDLHTAIDELSVIGNTEVFGILDATGTNTGPYLGIPPTHKHIDISVFEYWHFNSAGQVDVHNGIADLFGLISQFGFVPPGAVPSYAPSKVDPKFLPELNKG